jgi:hypothetical protein
MPLLSGLCKQETGMKHFHYFGSGPYCYANSLAMMFGDHAPSTTVIEFATSSPFGMQLSGGEIPFFDPCGWTPEEGVNAALRAIGWQSDAFQGGEETEALERLKEALGRGPVFIGPVEMGHLRHQPGMSGPIGADHFLIAVEADADQVIVHDPQGYPYASVPLPMFMAAWRADTIDYGAPYTMRVNFERVEHLTEEEIIERSTPGGIAWLSMGTSRPVAKGTLGNADAATQLADLIARGPAEALREHLVHFAVRVGARRLSDGATCLSRIGYAEAAAVMARQARLVGALQYPLVVGDDVKPVTILQELAATYEKLMAALARVQWAECLTIKK